MRMLSFALLLMVCMSWRALALGLGVEEPSKDVEPLVGDKEARRRLSASIRASRKQSERMRRAFDAAGPRRPERKTENKDAPLKAQELSLYDRLSLATNHFFYHTYSKKTIDENEDENKKLMQIQADTKAVGTAKKAAIMSRAEMKRAFNQRNQDLDKVLNPGEHNDRRRLFNSFKSYADSPKRPPQYSRNMYRKTDPSEFLAPRQKMAAEQRNSNLDDLKGWYDGHAVFKKLKAKKIALKRPPPVPMKAPPPGGVPKPRPVLRRQ